MNTTKELIEMAASITAGTVIRIAAYEDSSGKVRDIEAEVLQPDGYRCMQQDSLEILRKRRHEIEDFGVLVDPDTLADALDSLDKSFSSALDRKPEGAVRKGPSYTPVAAGSALHTLDGKDSAAVYLLRLRDYADPLVDDLTSCYSVATMKRSIIDGLNLPIGRYIHALKLEDGKFGAVEIVRPVR